MEFTVERSALVAMFDSLLPAVDRKPFSPIMSNVLIDAGTDGLEIQATDLEISVRRKCEAQVKTTGKTTANAKALGDFARSCPDGPISFSVSANGRLSITAGTCRFRLSTIPTGEFPEFPEAEGTQFALPSDWLRFAIRRSLVGTDQESNLAQVAHNCVRLEIHPDKARTVGFDAKKLALCELVAEFDTADPINFLMKRRAALELMRMTENGEEIIILSDAHNTIAQQEGYSLAFRNISAFFPSYEQEAAYRATRTATLQTADLKAAISRSRIGIEGSRGLARSMGGTVDPIYLEMSKDGIRVYTEETEHGSYSEVVPVESYAGESFRAKVNISFISDWLSASGSGLMTIEAAGHNKPIRFLPETEWPCRYMTAQLMQERQRESAA